MKTIGIAVLVLALVPAAAAAESADKIDCEMTFDLKSWSAFYKKADGEGTITCDNGATRAVKIRVRGGGLTVGKSELEGARAEFSEVDSIEELFGSYAQAEAHAGVVKSSGAQVMTKGEVSMALAGTGRGVDLGVSFGKFTIKPR